MLMIQQLLIKNLTNCIVIIILPNGKLSLYKKGSNTKYEKSKPWIKIAMALNIDALAKFYQKAL